MEAPSPKKRVIETSCLFTNDQNEDPFSSFNIKCSKFLDELPERSPCPKCNKSRRYYCYNCYVAVKEVHDKLPFLRLPVKIDVIKHPKEVDGKSTSAHAAVLAPFDVQVYTYPDFPNYDGEKVLLIFPGKSAIAFKDWWNIKVSQKSFCNQEANPITCHCKENFTSPTYDQINTHKQTCDMSMDDSTVHKQLSNLPFEKIVFIDSTWKQTKRLYGDPRIRSLPCVVLTSHRSLFWRHQRGKPETHLATIEAIYYFLVELHGLMYPEVPYCGRFDNLLFFFKFMYYKIRTLYDPLKLKAYQQARRY